jgi:threonine dehydrogenase-like Zn-dependent dehydrogenase
MTLTTSGIADPPVPTHDQLQALARQAQEQRLVGRIARIVEIGRVAVEEEPVRAPAEGEILVLTLLSGISAGTELSMVRGTNPYLHKRWDERLRLFVAADGAPQRAFPLDFGYEAVGVCAWSRHPHVREGDVVYGNWGHREWVTLKGQRYRSQLLPRALTIRDGIYPGQMGPIALNGVLHAAGRHQDATAVVFGAGVVGLLVAQIARADGAARVIVVDRLPYRLQAATELGFETLDVAAHDDAARALKEWVGGVPVAFECSGAYPALAEAIRCVANRGMVVALGFYQGDGAALRLGEEFHHNRVRLICAQIGALPEHLRRRDAEFASASLSDEVLRLAVSGQIRLGDLVSHIVPVEQIGEAVDLAMGRPNEALQVALCYPIKA